MNYALVAIGGALGASMRYGLGRALPAGAWPWGTLAANILGGFAMGLLASRMPPEPWRLLLGVGVLGGFTSFSAFSLEMFGMIERGAWGVAGAYAAASVLLALAALALGMAAGRAA